MKQAAAKKAAEAAAAKQAAADAAQSAAAEPPAGPQAAKPSAAERLAEVKRQLAEKKRVAAEAVPVAGAPKRPTIKRPTIKRPPMGGGGESAAQAGRPDGEGGVGGVDAAAGAHSAMVPPDAAHLPAPDAPAAATSCSLFVGDLPAGTTAADVSDLFSTLASVVDASVVGGAAYGFVTLESAADVDAVLDLVARNPPLLQGRPVRVARANGPGTGAACGRPHAGHGGPTPAAGADPAASHPRAVEAREVARTIAKQVGPSADFAMPGRELVTYDDL